MANWLAKQKKVDLNNLAAQAGFIGASGLKKDDLIPALDKHIQSNSSKLTSNSAFEEYFDDVRLKSRARRITKAAAEIMYILQLSTIPSPLLMTSKRSPRIKPQPRNNSYLHLSSHTHAPRPTHSIAQSAPTIAIRRNRPGRAPNNPPQQQHHHVLAQPRTNRLRRISTRSSLNSARDPSPPPRIRSLRPPARCPTNALRLHNPGSERHEPPRNQSA